jgi:hypothetical protein
MPSVVFEFRKKLPSHREIENAADDVMRRLLPDFSKFVETDFSAKYVKGSFECEYILGAIPKVKQISMRLYVTKHFPDYRIVFILKKAGNEVIKAKNVDDVARTLYSMFGDAINMIYHVEDGLSVLPQPPDRLYWGWMYISSDEVAVKVPVGDRLWLQIRFDGKYDLRYALEVPRYIDPLLPFIRQEVKSSGQRV